MTAHRIMLVENDREDRLMLQQCFDQMDPEPTMICQASADRAISYLEKCLQHPQKNALPNLIIVDLDLRSHSGLSVIKFIREHQALESLVIIVMSNTTKPEAVKKAYEAGANCYIAKAGTFNELKDTLELVYHYWFTTCTLPCDQPLEGAEPMAESA